MPNDTERMLGQLDGKLDTLLTLVRDHIQKDDDRFGVVFGKLEQHAADINQAKGAKSMLLLIAGGVSAVVGAAIAYFK